MRAAQLNRVKKLEEQHADDLIYHFERVFDQVYEDCPDAVRAREALNDYIQRCGPEPPRFYQYNEDQGMRRFIWALLTDEKAQALYLRLSTITDREVERRAIEREQHAEDKLLADWLESRSQV